MFSEMHRHFKVFQSPIDSFSNEKKWLQTFCPKQPRNDLTKTKENIVRISQKVQNIFTENDMPVPEHRVYWLKQQYAKKLLICIASKGLK